MSSESEGMARDMRMDTDNLYLEEVFTDLGAGTIRRLTPVQADGGADTARAILFMGQAQVMSAMGPIPLQFELDGPDLARAIASFPVAAEEAVRRMVEQIREMQRQQASQIVVPTGGMPPGVPSAPGGGRIKLR